MKIVMPSVHLGLHIKLFNNEVISARMSLRSSCVRICSHIGGPNPGWAKEIVYNEDYLL